MKRFRDLSIRTKLTVAILAITTLCLSIALTALGLQRASAFREDMRESITLIASAVAEYSVADLAFADREESAKTLERLRISPDIQSAALYDADGKLFATYRKRGSRQSAAPPERLDVSGGTQAHFEGDYLEVYVPVVYEGSRYGLIHIKASTASLGARTRKYFVTLAGLVAVLLVLTLLVAWAVQRVISRPILHLARAARTIADGESPSFRAAETSRDEIGTLARGFNTMLDHLERRQRELRESSETLGALIQACPLAIIAVDCKLEVTLWNAAAERIFGVAEADAVGRSVAELVLAPGVEEVWLACRKGDTVSGLELAWNRPGERAFELAFVAVPLNSGATHQGSMILAEDITERKQAQVALRERELQLQRMQKMDAVGRLAGGVSHDFNNLLSIIMMSARLANRYFDNHRKLSGEIDTILATAKRGSALTRRLLAFSALEPIKPEVVDINVIIADVGKMLRLVIGEDVQFRAELCDPPCHVLADPGQVEQVLLNLVINARDAMPRGGRLELRTEVIPPGPADETAPARGPAGSVVLVVSDSGCGMSPEIAARVFEPFFTTKAHGTGLGLATVYGIVAHCGGEITVNSRENAGTTFTVRLPRQVPIAVSPAELPVHALSLGRTTTTILLVEDEPRLRRVTRQVLEEEGHTVIEAENGVAALARCLTLSRPVDLLLTDVVMPEMGGPRLAQELLRRYPRLPVLYMSGYHGTALAASEGLEYTTFPILAKPFAPEDLIRKVNEILEQHIGRPFTGLPGEHPPGVRPGPREP